PRLRRRPADRGRVRRHDPAARFLDAPPRPMPRHRAGPILTTGHDRRIVADVVRDWASGHGRPFTLTLIRPAGGTYQSPLAPPPIELEATEFCRILSGRGADPGLLAHRILF